MWHPSGQSVLSKAVGITPSLKGRSAGRPSRASWNEPLDVLHRGRHLHRAGVVLLLVGSRIGDEVGELAEGEVDLHDAASASSSARCRRRTRPAARCAADVVEERGARVQARHDDWRDDLLPVLEHNAPDPAVGEERPCDPRVQPDLDAVAERGALDRGRHPAHAAFLEAPVAEVAVTDVADRVVCHHVRGAGLARPGPGADDPVDRHGALHLRRLEPVVEQVGDAHRHQAGHVGDRAHVEPPVAPGEPERLHQVGGPAGAEARRDGQEQRPEHLGEPREPGVPAGHRVGVPLRPLGDLVVVALGVVGEDLDRSPLREGLVVGAHREDLVAVALEVELPDDRRRHQAHHVGQTRHLELRGVGPRRLGRRRPARLVPRLQHERARAGSCEVGRGHQAVVTSANHDRVIGRGHLATFFRPPGRR